MAVGLHRGELWPGGEKGAPYVAGAPVCAMGAVCVARGATTAGATIRLIAGNDPALVALQAAIEGEDLADIAYLSDHAGRWLPRASWRSWWGARAMAAVLRRAARLHRG